MAIFLNGHEIPVNQRFPDGTFAFKIEPDIAGVGQSNKAVIRWNYADESECMALYYIVEHLRAHRVCCVTLELPYIPNARMDRVYGTHDVFTLKVFAKFINSLLFNQVFVLDPHSSVSAALIDRIHICSPEPYIRRAITEINDPNLVLFYPDEGAMKRYTKMIAAPYGFGVKSRDWESGSIKGLQLLGQADVKDRNVLIVDDICSRGGTFYLAAKALKEAGAKDINLYCSHCEQTIFHGALLTSDFVARIFTTDSIFSGDHAKITVFPWEAEA